MIYFNLTLRNPWAKDRFKNLWNRHGKTPLKHKFWEVEVIKSDDVLRLAFEWNVRQDHAGIQIELALLGYQLGAGIHDTRHWDYENNSWVNY